MKHGQKGGMVCMLGVVLYSNLGTKLPVLVAPALIVNSMFRFLSVCGRR